jgi:succinate dehydrogenase / fumarate reductase cytochrome b subunit
MAVPELGYGQLLWIVRIVLLTCAVLHIIAAYQLTILNKKARPVDYDTKKDVETTWGAITMRWSGVLVLVFVVFHIMHFTLGVVGFQPGQFVHLAVYQNIVAGFSVWPVAVFYIIAMAALCLHLDHGIWSGLQTLGWSTTENAKTLRLASRLIALVIFIGFILTPVSVMAGWIR